jgi:hypothetical protein
MENVLRQAAEIAGDDFRAPIIGTLPGERLLDASIKFWPWKPPLRFLTILI